MVNRRPRRYLLDRTPTTPTVDHSADKGDSASLLPLPPPSWVQSITHSLECQGASRGLTGAITRYFASLELEGAPGANAHLWLSGVVDVLFGLDGSIIEFTFEGRYAVSILSRAPFGVSDRTPPMRLESFAAIDAGRVAIVRLFPPCKRHLGTGSLPGDFDLPGVNDALPVNRPVKVAKPKDGRQAR